MKIALVYYSGAGNTKFIAQHLERKLKDKSHQVEMHRITNKPIIFSIDDIDLYIVGFPIYDLGAPALVSDFIKKLALQKKAISYFCTKAFMSADSIKELSDISTNTGLTTVASLDLFMPGTDLLAFGAKKNSRAEKIAKFFHSRNIGSKMDRFIREIEKNKSINIRKKWYSHLSFLIPKKSKKTFHAQYSKFVPKFYAQKEVCTECMLCVNNCPQENIQFKEGILFGLNCDMCLRCLHHCPVEAIQIGEATIGKSRYKEVTIKVK